MDGYTVTRKIHFRNSRNSRKAICRGEKPKRKPARIQRITRLMALAIHFDEMIRQGHVKDIATIARLYQVSRARMTQIMNLLLLAPDIQEVLLNLPKTTKGRDDVCIRMLQPIALEADWILQRSMFMYWLE
jgi:hypothetical protein